VSENGVWFEFEFFMKLFRFRSGDGPDFIIEPGSILNKSSMMKHNTTTIILVNDSDASKVPIELHSLFFQHTKGFFLEARISLIEPTAT
jgi:hypothetical protein